MWLIGAIVALCAYNFQYIRRVYASDNNTRLVMLNDTKNNMLFGVLKIYLKTKTKFKTLYTTGSFLWYNNSTIVNRNVLRINFLLDNESYTVDVPINRKLLSKKYNLSAFNNTNSIEFENRYNLIPLLVNPEKYGRGYNYRCQENDDTIIEIPKELLAYLP